jgi:hypothetical protein
MGRRENRLPACGVGGRFCVSCLGGAHGLSLNGIGSNCKLLGAGATANSSFDGV